MAGPVVRLIPRRRPRPVVSTTGLVALFTLALSSAATAQTDPLREELDSAGLVIEAIAGWDGTVDRSTPIPISFLIRNDSDRIIEGQLTLFDPMQGYEVTLGEVVVAPATSRRFTSIQNMSDWYECFATLSDGEQVLWRRELALLTGNEFDANVNFALFINDGGRSLQLPGALSGTATIAASEPVVAGEQGRPVRCLTVKTWQMPNHPGPLVAAQAMVFPEGADATGMNQVQWQAVAEWMCQGGVVFVHDESPEIIDHLIDFAPLGAAPAFPSSQFTVRRVGLGAIYGYPQPLLASEGSECRQLIAETIATLPKHHINTLADSGYLYFTRGGRADLNRVLVLAFFGLYTFLSGVVALLLFRLSQRRIAIYTFVIVVGASLLSGLLGGFLRWSQGDLRWITVTQAGAGGLVQVGNIDVQSAGGRNTQVAVDGQHADLQFTGTADRYYYWNQQQTACFPFTWQSNQLTTDDSYQINVTMTPWGRRTCHATAFQPEQGQLGFQLEFEPRTPSAMSAGAQAAAPAMPSGAFSLKLVNHLPFDLKDCWLVIGVTSAAPAGSMPADPFEMLVLPAGGQVAMPTAQVGLPTANGLIDVYHMHQLHDLPAGIPRDETFEAGFQIKESYWDLALQWENGSLTAPRITRLGSANAWIIGRIEESPILAINEQHSDFVTQEDLHVFVQEILPEDMPDASLFLPAGTDAAVETESAE